MICVCVEEGTREWAYNIPNIFTHPSFPLVVYCVSELVESNPSWDNSFSPLLHQGKKKQFISEQTSNGEEKGGEERRKKHGSDFSHTLTIEYHLLSFLEGEEQL